MDRMSIGVAILFSVLIHGCSSNSFPNDLCSRVRCANVESCPEGEYLVPADGVKRCCSSCRKYAFLGENCSENQCSPELYCDENQKCTSNSKCITVKCAPATSCPAGEYILPYDGIEVCCDKCQKYSNVGENCDTNYQCAEGLFCNDRKVCEEPTVNCAAVSCLRLDSCPEGQYLVPYDGVKQCCNGCLNYSCVGEPCGGNLKCADNLICTADNVCAEPEVNCAAVSCLALPSCPAGSYRVPADGKTKCCDTCRAYARRGDLCHRKKKCGSGLFCNKRHQCEPVADCTLVKCASIESCPPGQYLVPRDMIESCCDSCRVYSELGEHCDKDQKCAENLVCNRDHVCANEYTCPNGAYLIPYTGECVKYAGYGESCAKIACAKDYYCNHAKRCTPNDALDCSLVRCYTEDKCAPDKYLVPADGIAVCCNYCESYSDEGEWCTKHRKCLPDLTCNAENRCEKPPLDCSLVLCADVRGCPKGQHLVTGGKESCCNYCRDNSALGQPCSDTQPCNEGLFCNADNFCEKIDCTLVDCADVRTCPKDSFLVERDGVTRCCNSCRKYSQVGAYCDSTQPCVPETLNCNANHVCESS